MKTNKKYFDNRIISKPWGYEHVVFRNKSNLCVTYLNIKPNKQTSLHCHYKKKTGFIIVSGTAKIQLGLYERSSVIYKSPSKLMIRTGLFHQIKNVGKDNLQAFEFENPSDKFDLVRFEDEYGRIGKNYEVKENIKVKKKFDFFSKKKQNFKFKNCSIEIDYYKSLEKLTIKSNVSTIHTIMEGNIVNSLNKPVVPLGDIIKNGTIKKMMENFKIRKKIKVFSVFK